MRVVYADRKGSISSNNGSSSSATTTLANATSRRVGSGSFDDSNSTMGFVKGALEVVLPMCVSYFNHMGDQVLLDSSTRDLIHMQALDMANDGLRVLAVAKGTSSNQYTFCGILGLMDPLREGVKEAVARMQNSGARVVMITGDAKATAMSISKLAGIHDADEHDMDSQSYTNLVAAASSSSSSLVRAHVVQHQRRVRLLSLSRPRPLPCFLFWLLASLFIIGVFLFCRTVRYMLYISTESG